MHRLSWVEECAPPMWVTERKQHAIDLNPDPAGNQDSERDVLHRPSRVSHAVRVTGRTRYVACKPQAHRPPVGELLRGAGVSQGCVRRVVRPRPASEWGPSDSGNLPLRVRRSLHMNLLTKREVAARLSVSVSTVERYMRAGDLRVWRKGRIVRIPDEDVDALVRAQMCSLPSLPDVNLRASSRYESAHPRSTLEAFLKKELQKPRRRPA